MPKVKVETEDVATPEEQKIMDEFTQLRKVGPKTALKLVRAGYTSLESIAIARPEEIAGALDDTSKTGKEICNSAKAIALDKVIKPYTLDEIIDHKKNVTKRISTGSFAIDALMKGGIPTEAITILLGEYSSGKTQLCYQLAVNCIKSGRKVAWIETEPGTFVPDRLKEIADANGVKMSSEDIPFIMTAKAIQTPYNLFLTYEVLDKFLTNNKVDCGLIIIDSFSAKFRSMYTGREMLPDRAKEEARHFGYLELLASKYNCALVLTAQVMDAPDQGLQAHNLMKTGSKKEIFGGNVVKHSGTYIITLEKTSGGMSKAGEYKFIVADSPDIPFDFALFRIMPTGIKDVETRDTRGK